MGKTLTDVDVGSAPGAGDGDPARTAFQTVNTNKSALETAFFSDVSGEIAGLTAKATPTSSDHALIEDAAASNAKKRITLGNLVAVIRGLVNAYTKQQYFGEATLTDAANISWNLDNAQTAHVILGGNRTLSNPTNMHAGATYILRVEQDSSGSRTLAFDTAYLFPGGTAPTLTTTGGAIDILTFYSDGAAMYCVSSLDFS